MAPASKVVVLRSTSKTGECMDEVNQASGPVEHFDTPPVQTSQPLPDRMHSSRAKLADCRRRNRYRVTANFMMNSTSDRVRPAS